MGAVPFTAFCPECKAHRTFTMLGSEFRPPHPLGYVGCCVCGASEREALIALSERLTDDKDSIGEIAARLNTLDGELTELREEFYTHVDTRGTFAHGYSLKV